MKKIFKPEDFRMTPEQVKLAMEEMNSLPISSVKPLPSGRGYKRTPIYILSIEILSLFI
jgi:hypothetical protein